MFDFWISGLNVVVWCVWLFIDFGIVLIVDLCAWVGGLCCLTWVLDFVFVFVGVVALDL